jgi:threonine synthase
VDVLCQLARDAVSTAVRVKEKTGMDHVLGLRCLICDHEYGPDEVLYVCPKHGADGILDVQYDYAKIKERISPQTLSASGPRSIWRYTPLLPIDALTLATLHEGRQPIHPLLSVGWTPLYRSPHLAERVGVAEVYVKNDGLLPSASFKDRASAIAILKALELKHSVIAAASTGNAASSLATLSASLRIKNIIFVPAAAPQAKIAQLLVYGANVLAVDGTYDQAFELCLAASKTHGWYNRNTAYNPYMTEGKKTASYEICEQLGWQVPDRIFVGVGDGCIIGGLHKGLKDMLALGWIDRMPRLMGVQAAGSAALYAAWMERRDPLDMVPIKAHTIADSISAGLPRDRIKAMRAVVETGGAFVSVTDQEILSSIPVLARDAGVFAEPAGAAPYAGLAKAVSVGMVGARERVVVLVTGNGLKDVASAIESVGQPTVVKPTLEAVEMVIATLT